MRNRISISISLFLLPIAISGLQVPSIFAPFLEPEARLEQIITQNGTETRGEMELRRRDGGCPDNFNSCSTLKAAYGGACCTSGSVCTVDHANNVACCAIGALCTGSVSRPTGTTTSGGGGVVVGSTAATTTSTGTPTTTTTSSAPTGTITSAPTSIFSNPYFPFPYIATTYVNEAACMTAFSACQSNYAACTADLEGSGFAVTIVAPGGGITVAPTTGQNLGVASATSICSSLSAAACYNIQSSNCAQFGTTGFVVATSTGMGPRQTMGIMEGVGLLAGMGLGVLGMV